MANELNKAARIRVKDLNVVFNNDLDAPSIPLADFDPRALPAGWHQMGYLDRSQVLDIPRSGGDVTVDDTMNELAVDSEQAPIDRDITFACQQIETSILEVIYGSGLYDAATDEFTIPDQPVSTTRLYQIVYTGTKGQKRGWITPGSLSSTADLSMDPTKTSAIPVKIKCLKNNGKGLRMVGFGAPVVTP